MASPDHLRPLLEPALEGLGLLLEDVTVTPAGKRRVVRVTVDRALQAAVEVTEPTAPLSLDEVADATRSIGDTLDGSDVLGQGPYVLEVTSPGVDRPLREPRHFQRNVGRLVELTPSDGEPVTGRITRAGSADLTVDVGGHPQTIPYAALSRAAVQVEFSRRATDDLDPAPGEDPAEEN